MESQIVNHHKMLLFYRKLIMTGIEIEKRSEDKQIYGYRVVNVINPDDEQDRYYFFYDCKFTNLMFEKKIILKSSLPKSLIYLPMYILKEMIENTTINPDSHSILCSYISFLIKNQQINPEMIDFPQFIIDNMISKEGDYWYEHSGVSSEDIFNFSDVVIDKYIYQDHKYIQLVIRKNIQTGKVEYVPFEIFDEMTLDYQRIFKYVRDSSKFGFDKPSLIEYTLNDILEYINQQIYICECFNDRSKIIHSIEIEAKEPSRLNKYLQEGHSIQDALSFVGYS
jgi:hypothetical protein